jgi:hypothetical protein
LHKEFKRRITTQTVLSCAETAPMPFWALLAIGHITMRKVDGWQTFAEMLDNQIIVSPRDRIASCRPKTREPIPTHVATGLRCRVGVALNHRRANPQRCEITTYLMYFARAQGFELNDGIEFASGTKAAARFTPSPEFSGGLAASYRQV